MNTELYYKKKYIKYKNKYLLYKNNLKGGFELNLIDIVKIILKIIIKINSKDNDTIYESNILKNNTLNKYFDNENFIIFLKLIHCILCKYLSISKCTDSINYLLKQFNESELNIQLNLDGNNITNIFNGNFGNIFENLLNNLPCKNEFVLILVNIMQIIKQYISNINNFNVNSIILYKENIQDLVLICEYVCKPFNIYQLIFNTTFDLLNKQVQKGGQYEYMLNEYLTFLEKLVNSDNEILYNNLLEIYNNNNNNFKVIILCINIIRIFKQIFNNINNYINLELIYQIINILIIIEKVLILVCTISCDIKDTIINIIYQIISNLEDENIKIIIKIIYLILKGENDDSC
jgi:hypothetical protein